MKCRNRPLYPAPGWDCGCRERPDACESWRMPLFSHEPMHAPDNCGCQRQTVRLENPCCPGEFAEVTLKVDECGNLVVCVHRNGHPPHHCRHCCK